MFDKVREYIDDNRFKITIYEDRIHVINYEKIISLEEERIVFLTKNKKIIVHGQNMHLNRPVEDHPEIQYTLWDHFKN